MDTSLGAFISNLGRVINVSCSAFIPAGLARPNDARVELLASDPCKIYRILVRASFNAIVCVLARV